VSHRHAAPAAAAALLALVLSACAPAAAPAPATVPPVRDPVPAPASLPAAAAPAFEDVRIHEIAGAPAPARLERDVRRLVDFGTRHTLADTLSPTRGIGAARRWLFDEFQRISEGCGGCLEVRYVSEVLEGGSHPRIPRDVEIVNVVAIQRGVTRPGHHVLMTAHYDSRIHDVLDATGYAPGANDDASGVAATLEAARLLSRYPFDHTIVYAALAGEEQGLFGGEILARHAAAAGWRIEGVLNNDIVGNIHGDDGVIDNTRVRVFAPGIPPTADAAELRRLLYTGGELDVPSRQLARYVHRVAGVYLPNLRVQMIYRLDRFGRGGDHTPFFLAGYPAVRLTEPHESYRRQHQDVRVEGGVRYGDLPEGIDYAYLAKVTALNAAAIAALAWAPPAPGEVSIRGAVLPSTTLRWTPAEGAAGYRVYWRDPTAPFWERSRWVGNVTEFTLENVTIDNWFFGVAAVGPGGHESLVVWPRGR
jgi:hypothetical protein